MPPTRLTTVPPSPVHANRKVTRVPAVNGPMLAVPDVDFVPLQASDATQLLAFVVDHVSGKTPFTGLAIVKERVG
ncbi:MAG TPA: hypothetical protein VL379_10440 [Pseudomonadales bacterium]|nr:hypothetical protein [Pseudomonadales bacterium]